MTIFKCKMCGGTIEFEPGDSVGICDSCGTKQTLPKLDDDRRANLYDRANHFRRNNEFDKAMGIYENILNEDSNDAEAYWSIVLCRYGIEYVEDPLTHKRVPTVNRAQFTSIFDDDNYKSALANADGYQRVIYEEEANAINEIQKGILAISQKEEPFDVFICYKETDANGRRTQDSVLANDLYHQLTQEGFKVFFSRITLEDKLGTAYEPYIFAALNSSKVMVVLGTKPEYFNAVWVKNEWSRYLGLIKNGAKKMLIPAYRDMDPYDLPDEFSHLQAQDMSKLGFMQDLIRGIKKIISEDTPKETVKETVVYNQNTPVIAPLLERIELFLEDGKWQDANIYCEKVLDIDPKNAQAYLGKLMAELKVRKREQLQDLPNPFDNLDNYFKVLRYGDSQLEEEVRGYIDYINNRNKTARQTFIYNQAKQIMDKATTEEGYTKAQQIFQTISGFKDSDTLASECHKMAIYKNAIYNMKVGTLTTYEKALNQLQTIAGWKDADALINKCQIKIEEMKCKEEHKQIERENRTNMFFKCLNIGLLVLIVVCILWGSIGLAKGVIDKKKEKAESVAFIEKYGEEYYNIVGYSDVGDCIYFGSYEQDNNLSNGNEQIEWIILEKDETSLMLMSKKVLDVQQYNQTLEEINWEDSYLRQWLNGTFLNTAFSDDEISKIVTTAVKDDDNANEQTNDKVFLLSNGEFQSYRHLEGVPDHDLTSYASKQYKTLPSDAKTGFYLWLRLRSIKSENAIAFSKTKGNTLLLSVDHYYLVRPVIWIDFSK